MSSKPMRKDTRASSRASSAKTQAAYGSANRPMPSGAEQPSWDPEYFTTGFLPFLINRASSLWDAEFKHSLRKLDISVLQWRVIGVLRSAPGIPLRELTGRTGINQPTLSRIIDQLEERSLVQRGSHESDGRYLALELTKAGDEMFETLWNIAWTVQLRGTSNLTEAEKQSLVVLVRKMIDNLLD